MAHAHALMLQLSLGKFFFFFLAKIVGRRGSTRVSHADRDLYGVYGSLVTRGNLISADQWATNFVNNHASTIVHPNSLLANENIFTADAIYVDGITYPNTPSPANRGAAADQYNSAYGPLTNSNPAPFDGRTFAAGKGYNGDNALPTAPFCHSWETAGDAAHLDNHAFAPLINSNTSRLTESTFAAGVSYGDVAASPNPPIPYTWGPAATTAHSSDHIFAPLIASRPLHTIENTFATGAAYHGGNANPSAPWGPEAHTDYMDPFSDLGLQYAGPTLPMMRPFAANANGTGNDYQGRTTAPSFNTPLEATVDHPKTPHATHESDLDLAPKRPTCAECNKSFTRKADLDRHAKKHQVDAKVFRCGVAGCTFDNYRKDKVSVHIRRRHGGVGTVLTLA